ncbi:MAG TPA: hypothetical protein VNJ52_10470 [Patescibacteria group bacterium]|nr:hypothetical protein [Patescibacteria group bacterium]
MSRQSKRIGATEAAQPSSTPGRGRVHAARILLLLLLAAALLVPIWTVSYPPLVDYPNHLASAFVLAHLKDSAFDFGRYYAADWNTFPYLTMDWILVALQWVVPIDVAGRLLLSLCALSVPAAAWFFLRQANPGEESLALWSLLIAENLYFFVYGFINMQLSLALCLVVLGVWLGYLKRPRMTLWLLLLPLTTFLYFTHLMGFGVAGVVITVYAVIARQRLKRLLFSWLLFLPGLLFFLHSHSHLKSSWNLQFRGLGAKVSGLLAVMVGASPALDFLTLAVIAVSLILAMSQNREFGWNRRWLGVAGCLFALYWIFPASYATGMNADRRLLPFIFIIALAAARVGKRARELAIIAILLFAVRTGVLAKRFISEQPRLARMVMSYAVIPKNAKVLPLVGWAGGTPQPERNLWAYGVIERGWFSPCLFHDPGVQPLQLKVRLYDPYGAGFGDLGTVDWQRASSDYGYVWAAGVPQFTKTLEVMGKPIFRSGNLQVYRLFSSSPGPQDKSGLRSAPTTSARVVMVGDRLASGRSKRGYRSTRPETGRTLRYRAASKLRSEGVR